MEETKEEKETEEEKETKATIGFLELLKTSGMNIELLQFL